MVHHARMTDRDVVLSVTPTSREGTTFSTSGSAGAAVETAAAARRALTLARRVANTPRAAIPATCMVAAPPQSSLSAALATAAAVALL